MGGREIQGGLIINANKFSYLTNKYGDSRRFRLDGLDIVPWTNNYDKLPLLSNRLVFMPYNQ